jgi:predicted MFS family arabinose efflux permease
VTAGLAIGVYALVDANDAGWTSTQTLVLGAISLALLAVFSAVERRSPAPLVPFSIFRLRSLRGSNIVGLLIGMSLFSMFFFISLYLQQVLHYSALKAGFSYLPLALVIIFSAGAASQLVTKIGFKPSLIIGMVFIAAGLLWFSRVSPDGTYLGDVLFPSILAAIGLGFSFVPVTIGAVMGTKPQEAGLASGLINTSQQVGGALGLAILSSIATSRTNAVAGGARPDAAALTEGFQTAFLVGAGFAVTGAILAAVLISSRDSREQVAAARDGRPSPLPNPA